MTDIGFGCSPIGNLYEAIPEQCAADALEAAWQAGCRYFDVAPLYGYGLAETRLNRFLRCRPREELVLSTKVGRLLSRCLPAERSGIGKFYAVPSRKEKFDYGYDATMRSFEDSLERLGVDRIDILYAHDLDVFTHGTTAKADGRIEEFMGGGYRAMCDLRDEGVVGAIGAGVNESAICERLIDLGDFDIFLLAGRYTLLEQDAVETLFPLCERRGVRIVVGGPFNSGILATGAREGAYFNYSPADEAILARVRRLEKVCVEFNVPLVAAALQFPLGHPVVASVIPGGKSPDEARINCEMVCRPIPTEFWTALRDEKLLRSDVPLPVSAGQRHAIPGGAGVPRNPVE